MERDLPIKHEAHLAALRPTLRPAVLGDLTRDPLQMRMDTGRNEPGALGHGGMQDGWCNVPSASDVQMTAVPYIALEWGCNK